MKTVIEDDKQWLGKLEAAKLLGVSVRQLELKTAQGKVQKRTLPKLPSERSARVVYFREDLDAIRAGRPNHHGENGHETANGASTLARKPFAPSGDALALLTAALARIAPAAPVVRPWLTLAEAVEYSGLPAAYLVASARKGTFRAINVGTGAREFWRFSREGLSK